MHVLSVHLRAVLVLCRQRFLGAKASSGLGEAKRRVHDELLTHHALYFQIDIFQVHLAVGGAVLAATTTSSATLVHTSRLVRGRAALERDGRTSVVRADIDLLFVNLTRDGLSINIFACLVLLVHSLVQLHKLHLLIVQ